MKISQINFKANFKSNIYETKSKSINATQSSSFDSIYPKYYHQCNMFDYLDCPQRNSEIIETENEIKACDYELKALLRSSASLNSQKTRIINGAMEEIQLAASKEEMKIIEEKRDRNLARLQRRMEELSRQIAKIQSRIISLREKELNL